MQQVLAWAMDHDLPAALRPVAALGWWWHLRGRLASQYPLLCQAAGAPRRAVTGVRCAILACPDDARLR